MTDTKSVGIGDTVEKVLTATGTKAVVDKFWKDCGCDKRKAYLNKALPFKKNQCMSRDQYDRWRTDRKVIVDLLKGRGTLQRRHVELIFSLHTSIFGWPAQKPCMGCKGSANTWKNLIDNVERKYQTYFRDIHKLLIVKPKKDPWPEPVRPEPKPEPNLNVVEGMVPSPTPEYIPPAEHKPKRTPPKARKPAKRKSPTGSKRRNTSTKTKRNATNKAKARRKGK